MSKVTLLKCHALELTCAATIVITDTLGGQVTLDITGNLPTCLELDEVTLLATILCQYAKMPLPEMLTDVGDNPFDPRD